MGHQCPKNLGQKGHAQGAPHKSHNWQSLTFLDYLEVYAVTNIKHVKKYILLSFQEHIKTSLREKSPKQKRIWDQFFEIFRT